MMYPKYTFFFKKKSRFHRIFFSLFFLQKIQKNQLFYARNQKNAQNKIGQQDLEISTSAKVERYPTRALKQRVEIENESLRSASALQNLQFVPFGAQRYSGAVIRSFHIGLFPCNDSCNENVMKNHYIIDYINICLEFGL